MSTAIMARFDFGDNLMKVRLDQRKKPGTFLLDQCATAVLSYLLVAIAAALAAGRRVRSSQGPRPKPAAPLLPLLGPKNLSHFFAAITFLSARSRKSRSGVTRVRARAFSRRTATTHVFLEPTGKSGTSSDRVAALLKCLCNTDFSTLCVTKFALCKAR
jgi:hypothetical protein